MKLKSHSVQSQWKVIAAVALIVYIIGNLIAWSSPATGVEVNIYNSTPQFYWIALIITYFTGIWLTLSSLTSKSSNKLCKFTGYTLLTLACISLVGLTTIRGYYLLNVSKPQDMAFHFACVNDILEYGAFNIHSSNPYPLTHIAYSIYFLLINSELRIIVNILPLFGTLLFLGGTYLLAKHIFKNKNVLPFIYIFCSIVPFGSVTLISWGLKQPMPTTFSYYILPLLFALILISTEYKNQLLLIPVGILTFFAVFIHPLVLFVVIMFIISILIAGIIRYLHNHNREVIYDILKITIILIIIAGLSFFLWHFSTRMYTIGSIIMSILSPAAGGNNEITTGYLDRLSTGFSLGYGIFDIIKMGCINLILYSMIPLAGILFLLTKDYLKKDWHNLLIIFVFALLVCGLTGVIAFTSTGVHCSRYMAFMTMSGIICAGYLSYRIYTSRLNRQMFVKFVTILLLAGFVISSIVCYYPSPITKGVMAHDTVSEITAIETLVPVIDITRDRDNIYFDLNRAFPYVYGLGQYKSVQGDKEYVLSGNDALHYGMPSNPEKLPLFHFRYDTFSKYGDAIKEETYLFLWQKDIDYYPAYVPELLTDRFTETDYKHLHSDKTVNQYYNSGEIGAYSIDVVNTAQ